MITLEDGRVVECPVCCDHECSGCEIPYDEVGYYITGSYEERLASGLQAAIERCYQRNADREEQDADETEKSDSFVKETLLMY